MLGSQETLFVACFVGAGIEGPICLGEQDGEFLRIAARGDSAAGKKALHAPDES
jgi:hypothetical protein